MDATTFNSLANYGVLGVILAAVGAFFWLGLWPFTKEQIIRLVAQVESLNLASLKQADAFTAAIGIQRDAHIAAQARFLEALQRIELDSAKQGAEHSEILRTLVSEVKSIDSKVDRVVQMQEEWSGPERRRKGQS